MPKVSYDVESRGAVKSIQDLAKAQKEVAAEGDKAAVKLTKMERAAQRIKEANDPVQRYNRHLKETARLANAGAISTKDAELAAQRHANALDRARKSGQGAFGAGALKQVSSLVTGYLSVHGALALITSEMQLQKKLQEDQTRAQLDVAQAEQNLRQNIVGLDKDKREPFIQDVLKIAADANLPAAQILDAAKDVFSATSDTERTKDILTTTTSFTRDPAAIAQLSGAVADVIATGAAKGANEALGFLSITAAGSRVTSVPRVGERVGTVAASFTSELVGSDAATGASLFAALTKAGADNKGERTGTATIQIPERLAKFFADEDVAKRFKPEEIDTFNEQLALTRGTPLGREFAKSDEFKFEAQVKGGISKFFLGDAESNTSFVDTLSKLSDPEQLSKSAVESLEFVNRGSLAATAQQELAVSSSLERFQLSSEADFSEKSREAIINLLATAKPLPLTQQRLETFLETGTTLDRQEAIGLIEPALRSNEAGLRNGLQNSERQNDAVVELRSMVRKLTSIESNQRGGRVSPEGIAE